MILKWILSLLTVAIFQITSSVRFCNVPKSNLELQYKTGLIKPAEYPYKFVGGQSCVWKFPNDKFSGLALFLFIKEVDLTVDKTKLAGDIIIDEHPITKLPDANCRLYGQSLSDIDVVALANFTAHRHEARGRFCKAWHINSRLIEQIEFRSFGEENVTHNKTKFFITFDYISVRRKSADRESSDGFTVRPYSATPPNSANDDHKVYNSDAKKAFTKSPNVTIAGMSNKSCEDGSIFTAVIVTLAVLLAITCSSLIYVICKNRQSKNHVYKIAPEAVIPSSEATPPGQDHSNVVYAAIEENVTIETNSTSTSRSQLSAYDVPTSNRPRAPTAVSCVSTVSEHHYQYPNSLSAVAEEGEPTQQPVEESKDVYAVVNKNRK